MTLNPFVKAGIGLSFALLWSCPTLAALTQTGFGLFLQEGFQSQRKRPVRFSTLFKLPPDRRQVFRLQPGCSDGFRHRPVKAEVQQMVAQLRADRKLR